MNKKQQGQSFLDLVIQQSGSMEEVVKAAVYNNASITDDLAIGTKVDNRNVVNQDNVALFNKKNQPATALRNSLEEIETGEGIGYWGIAETLIVS